MLCFSCNRIFTKKFFIINGPGVIVPEYTAALYIKNHIIKYEELNIIEIIKSASFLVLGGD